MLWHRRKPALASAVLFLVYTRPDPEADEPLAAAVASELDAVDLEARARRSYPGLEVRWEEIPFKRARAEGPAEVHVVATGSLDNTIGIRAFDDPEEADRMVNDGLAQGQDLHRQTVPFATWLSAEYPLECGEVGPQADRPRPTLGDSGS